PRQAFWHPLSRCGALEIEPDSRAEDDLAVAKVVVEIPAALEQPVVLRHAEHEQLSLRVVLHARLEPRAPGITNGTTVDPSEARANEVHHHAKLREVIVRRQPGVTAPGGPAIGWILIIDGLADHALPFIVEIHSIADRRAAER